MYLSRKPLFVVAAILLGSVVFGKSSKLVTSWKNPKYVAKKTVHRVLALGLSDKTEIRADFEDALAAQLGKSGLDTIPGHTILLRPEGEEFDLNYLRTQVRENHIDAVVVSRLVKVEHSTRYIPSASYFPAFPYYNTFYGYYSTVYPVVYAPGYLKEEKTVRIETNLYVISSAEGELVWTGITDTFNPSNIKKAIDRLVKLVANQMQREGVL